MNLFNKVTLLFILSNILTACSDSSPDLVSETLAVATANSGDSCSQLAAQSLPNTIITQAQSIPAGEFLAPDRQTYSVPAFCKVHGVAVPTRDSHINFEVWLPTDWNGRYYQLGTGGFAGAIDRHARNLVDAIRRGHAVSMTNGGRNGVAFTDHGFQYINPNWSLHQPEKMIDVGYRASKETSDKARLLIQAFYGRSADYAYYAGCSGGGRETLTAAQRYPNEWDGFLIGAPSADFIRTYSGFVWNEQVLWGKHGASAAQISAAKLPAIQQAALASCSAEAHVFDGVAADPRFCRPNTKSLLCQGEETDHCLTAQQAAALQQVYAGPRQSFGDKTVSPGIEATMEAEGEWENMLTGKLRRGSQRLLTVIVNHIFRNLVYNDPEWQIETLDFTRDIDAAINKRISAGSIRDVLGVTTPDFSQLKHSGAKVIMYHGWGDAIVPPRGSIEDYQLIEKSLGGVESSKDHYRLYMVPGLQHCFGGPGANAFGQVHTAPAGPSLQQDAKHDIALALEQWVEKGIAPDTLIATKYIEDKPEKGVAFTRPLCPFPQVPVYQGRGDTTQASSFICQVGAQPDSLMFKASGDNQ